MMPAQPQDGSLKLPRSSSRFLLPSMQMLYAS